MRVIAAALVGVAVVVVTGVFVERHGPVIQDRADRIPSVLREPMPLNRAIRIRTTADAAALRSRLVEFAFGQPRLPSRLPLVERGVVDEESRPISRTFCESTD